MDKTKERTRKSGVLLHVSSLWGEYSCGSFSNAAKEFIDFLSDCGFSYWQTLPFCVPDVFASPYSSSGAFSLNPDFIDITKLRDAGLLDDYDLFLAKQSTPYVMEYEKLRRERFDLLKKAAARFTPGADFDEFFKTHPHTESFCRFMALKSANGDLPFWQWTNDKFDEVVLYTWKFICFTFIEQWREIKEYANEIVGDIPIYVSLDSADVWENSGEYLLGENFCPTKVAGVPPDYFSPEGQLWGNPLYDWGKMEQNGFAWWRARAAFMCELFDCLRIDHFRGIESFYAIPYGAENAKVGEWIKGPGMKLINAIKEACPDKLLIAEDLGIMTDEVIKLVSDSGFPGMRVMQFGFDGDPENMNLPHNYPRNCIAYTGTHDNNTLLACMWEMDEKQRTDMLNYCGYHFQNWDCKEAYEAVMHTLLQSPADTVILPLQDILCYGGDTRMNVPGKEDGNWGWRLTKAQLDVVDRGKWKYYNKIYCRTE